jgi:hypothetical protein
MLRPARETLRIVAFMAGALVLIMALAKLMDWQREGEGESLVEMVPWWVLMDVTLWQVLAIMGLVAMPIGGVAIAYAGLRAVCGKPIKDHDPTLGERLLGAFVLCVGIGLVVFFLGSLEAVTRSLESTPEGISERSRLPWGNTDRRIDWADVVRVEYRHKWVGKSPYETIRLYDDSAQRFSIEVVTYSDRRLQELGAVIVEHAASTAVPEGFVNTLEHRPYTE